MILDEMVPTFCPNCKTRMFENEGHKRQSLGSANGVECPNCKTRYRFEEVWFVFSQADYSTTDDFLGNQ